MLNTASSVKMTRYILVQPIITIHSYSLHVRARKVVVISQKLCGGKFVAGIDRDPVPNVVSCVNVATGTEKSVSRVILRCNVVRDRHLINVGWNVYPGSSNTSNLQM